MDFFLDRTYKTGLPTNGSLSLNGNHVCYTIELPWLNNQHSVSCIEEGTYLLNRCYSKKFGWHLILKDVQDRKFISIHPANNSLEELQGCIAPVVELLRPGIGTHSKDAMTHLCLLAFPALKRGENVYLIISSAN
jgi:hypothetical protein